TGAPNEAGYWVVADDGQVFNFGDARQQPRNDGQAFENTSFSPCVDMTSTPDGQGYWVLQTNGTVHSFGNTFVHAGPGPVND
ncbi:hypothetical protein, partial [Klebsiella pneumoniae]|uniref:hypothetical protein n=1 Tax=Klebsiella pneumoniae TaxID=573 RepID=UPI001D0E13D7